MKIVLKNDHDADYDWVLDPEHILVQLAAELRSLSTAARTAANLIHKRQIEGAITALVSFQDQYAEFESTMESLGILVEGIKAEIEAPPKS